MATFAALLVAALYLGIAHSQYTSPPDSSCTASRLYLSDSPHDNYFYSDCHSSSHVIVTSPRSGNNINIIKPRLIIAWPAGNSGILALFAPEGGQAGSLGIRLENSTTTGQPLDPIYDSSSSGNPRVGVSGSLSFNDTARLTVPIQGSIRTIRDFTEGGSTNQDFQGSFGFSDSADGSVTVNRTWLDGVTTSWLKFTPLDGAQKITINRDVAWTLSFGRGKYRFEASYNYPQMEQLSPQQVLASSATGLIGQEADLTTSLSFLSYKNKLLAGTWRFLTYFGRDSLISLLLMQDILSETAIEAVLAAAVERVNRQDGTVCHEEVLGDYATWLNRREGISSSAPRCDYKMIDTDFFLPIAVKSYFLDRSSGRSRSDAFFRQSASFLAENSGQSYAQLFTLTAAKIMRIAAPFAASQTAENLIKLNDGEMVGEWRDSNNGLGGGRTPYDVNTALVPAALRAIAALGAAGWFPDHSDWTETAARYAQIWEDETLRFFRITVSKSDAISRVQGYVSNARLPVPASTNTITSDITYYGLALDTAGTVVPVMNTDDCFRHFFVNATNQTQLSAFLDQTADHILQPFPVGLATDVGLFVANPAYSNNAGFAAGFSNTDYHGTVVWSWQLAMMGAGLGRQLGRCGGSDAPDFCQNSTLYAKILSAYNRLWDIIDANRAQLSHEVWSWSYASNKFQVQQLGTLTSTESNVRQLWSLTFLAVKRMSFGGNGVEGLVKQD